MNVADAGSGLCIIGTGGVCAADSNLGSDWYVFLVGYSNGCCTWTTLNGADDAAVTDNTSDMLANAGYITPNSTLRHQVSVVNSQ